LLSITSCKKQFLEVVNKTVLLREGYVVDLKTTGEYLNGIYVDMASYYTDGLSLPYPEVMADNMKVLQSIAFTQAYNWSFVSSTTELSIGDPLTMWRQYYGIIRSCNFAIEKANEFKSQNESKANSIIGQALAVRAMVHFTLCNMFAQAYNFTSDASHLGIPYIVSSDLETKVTRQTVFEVYQLMIDDLRKSINILSSTLPVVDKRIMNHVAAKALLARISLFKEDYMFAKDLSRQVLEQVPLLKSSDYPSKLYTDMDTEALFWMPPGSTTGTKPTPGYFAGFIGFFASTNGGLFYCATKDIASLLTENSDDKRRTWVKDTLGNWQIRKFPQSTIGPASVPEFNYNQSLFRSSEMCLTAAESYAKINMEDSARFYIDLIRQRANPSLPNLVANGPALLDTIYKERRKEMCFDGLRMWDLKRWKYGVQRGDVFGGAPTVMPYPSNKAIAAIPLTDVQLSGLEQNDDY
jgi:starch-binding outer membrane protein, SusD/RagB family